VLILLVFPHFPTTSGLKSCLNCKNWMSKPVDVNSDWLAACLVNWDLVSWAGKGPGYPGESCEGCLSSKTGKNII
jgi:hypothetical protein